MLQYNIIETKSSEKHKKIANTAKAYLENSKKYQKDKLEEK